MISAHTFAYISLDAMIPQETDQTRIEYGFPVFQRDLAMHSDWIRVCFGRESKQSPDLETILHW